MFLTNKFKNKFEIYKQKSFYIFKQLNNVIKLFLNLKKFLLFLLLLIIKKSIKKYYIKRPESVKIGRDRIRGFWRAKERERDKESEMETRYQPSPWPIRAMQRCY